MTAWVRGTLRLLAVFALASGLTGCFKSASPLIDAENAKFPFKSITLKTAEGDTEVIKRDGGVYRRTENGKPSDETLLLYEIAEQLYLLQESSENGDPTYVFAKREGYKVVVRGDCHGLPADKLEALKFDIRDTANGIFKECYTPDLKALIALARSPDIWSQGSQTLQIQSLE
jgi:hypothetical protein